MSENEHIKVRTLLNVIFLKSFLLLAHDGFFMDSFQLQVYSLASSRMQILKTSRDRPRDQDNREERKELEYPIRGPKT